MLGHESDRHAPFFGDLFSQLAWISIFKLGAGPHSQVQQVTLGACGCLSD